MRYLSQLIGRDQLRPFLIAVTVLLLLLNGGRWLYSLYEAKQEEIDSKIAMLEQHRLATSNIETLQAKVEILEKTKKQLDNHLFSGGTEEEIASASQIMLQKHLTTAGLEPESIRPIRQAGEKNIEKSALNKVLLKVNLTGTLNQFMAFIANLYRSPEFLKIENLSFKSYKNDQLKIFMDLKGFYRNIPGNSVKTTEPVREDLQIESTDSQ
ncbi:MAG: hypothetical protein KKB30_12005 [Proteobacteria bacterium]|nr:hypothetical protein [Pseudomonadota bacterium]MBU1716620.1 hypothetical protein [Pseudomonadota bacterium]